MINVDLSDKQLEIRARGAQILRIGFDLLEAGGLENVRLDSIAEQLGCTRSTIYNHYKNREEVLVAICLLYTSPSPRDLSTSRMPSSA